MESKTQSKMELYEYLIDTIDGRYTDNMNDLPFIDDNTILYGSFDLETNKEQPSQDNEEFDVNEIDYNEVSVVAGMIMLHNDNHKMYFQYTIEDTMKMFFALQCKKANFYAHNLSFDGVFVLNELNRLGFTQVADADKHRPTAAGRKAPRSRRKKLDPFTYSVIFNAGQIYEILFCTPKGIEIRMRDTAKISMGTLAKLSKDWNGILLPKDGWDYDKNRGGGNYQFTKDEIKYMYGDVFATLKLVELFFIDGIEMPDGTKFIFDQLTAAGQALKQYKKTLAQQYHDGTASAEIQAEFDKLNVELEKQSKKTGKVKPPNDDRIFRSIFPLQSHLDDSFTRKSYSGGITRKNNKNIEKMDKLKEKKKKFTIRSYDVNSLYPSVMHREMLPYGNAVYFNGSYANKENLFKELYPCFVQRFIVRYFQVKKDGEAILQIKGKPGLFNANEFLENNLVDGVHQPVELTMTQPQMEMFFRNYDTTKPIFLDGRAYKSSSNLFKTYIDYWMRLKETSTGAVKELSKLLLNSLYGKLAQDSEREVIEILNENGVFKARTYEHHGEKLYTYAETVYTVLASYITSFSRVVLETAMRSNSSNWLYCDTDSIFVLGDVKGIPLDVEKTGKLGLWKAEKIASDGVFIGAKRYAVYGHEDGDKDTTNKWMYKCCGLSRTVTAKIEFPWTFDVNGTIKNGGRIDPNKLHTKDDSIHYYHDEECTRAVVGIFRDKRARNVKGGKLIEECPFIMKEKFYGIR